MIKNLFMGMALVLFIGGILVSSVEAAEEITFNSYHDINNLFEKEGYTEETWKAGDREVPRLYLTAIPKEWWDTYSKEVTVQLKKQLFFRLLAPGVLHCNELIIEDRKKLESLVQKGKMTEAEQKWLSG